MPEREDREHPYLPPAHVVPPGSETLQQTQCRGAVDPFVGLCLAQEAVGKLARVGPEPVTDWNWKAELGPLSDRFRQD